MTLQKLKDEVSELKTLVSNFLTKNATKDEIAGFQTRLGAVEAEVTNQAKAISDRDTQIVDLQAQLKTATDKNTELGTQVTNLTKDVESEKKRANDVLAAQGLDPSTVPAAEAEKGEKVTAWNKYQSLLASKDSAAAGTFYAENADKILASRPK
jgi:chromosome segregation ATPase